MKHEEYLARLEKLKLIEEKTLEYLSAVRMEKCLTWVKMNRDLGKSLSPKVRVMDPSEMARLEEDLKLLP